VEGFRLIDNDSINLVKCLYCLKRIFPGIFSNIHTSMVTHNPSVLYSAAMALNNLGVTLLMQFCFDDALLTFQDALEVMRYSFSISDEEISYHNETKDDDLHHGPIRQVARRSEHHQQHVDINRKVLAASERLARNGMKMNCNANSNHSSMSSLSLSRIVLEKNGRISDSLYDAAMNTTVFDILGEEEPTKGMVMATTFLIHIDNDEYTTEHMTNLDMAAFMNNYGVAIRCLHFQSGKIDNNIHALLKARKFFQLSHESLLDADDDKIVKVNSFLTPLDIYRNGHLLSLLLVSLVLQNMMQISMQINDHPDLIHGYYSELRYQRSNYDAMVQKWKNSNRSGNGSNGQESSNWFYTSLFCCYDTAPAA
jgi:hypothetical protein